MMKEMCLKEEGSGRHMKTQKRSLPEDIRKCLLWILRIAGFSYLILMGVILPFYYHPASDYMTIGSCKAELFNKWGIRTAKVVLGLILLYAVVVLIQQVREKRAKKGSFITGTELFAVCYIVVLCISYWITDYRDFAKMGADGWNMGFWPQIVFLFFFLFFVHILTPLMAKVGLGLMITASTGVFLLGLLNRYGINPLKMDSSGPGFISTIGNINWYCGYWSVLFPLSCGLFVFCETAKKQQWLKWLCGIASAVGFATGVSQGSDSGLLVLAGLILLLGWLAGEKTEWLCNFLKLLFLFSLTLLLLFVVQHTFPDRNQYLTSGYLLLVNTPLGFLSAALVLTVYAILFWKKEREAIIRIFAGSLKILVFAAMGLLIIYIVLLIYNTLHPGKIAFLAGNPLFTFDEKWGSFRGATWTIGFHTFFAQDFSHRLFGVGPDSMAAYLYDGKNATLLQEVRSVFGDKRLTNAHGEWITVLVDTGLMGLLSFASMIVSGIASLLEKKQNVLCKICAVSIFCYTLHNMFSFEQMMNISQMYLVLGIGFSLFKKEKEEGS